MKINTMYSIKMLMITAISIISLNVLAQENSKKENKQNHGGIIIKIK